MREKDRIISLCLLIAGAGMIVLGVFRGEHIAVLEKATKICLECMGIG